MVSKRMSILFIWKWISFPHTICRETEEAPLTRKGGV